MHCPDCFELKGRQSNSNHHLLQLRYKTSECTMKQMCNSSRRPHRILWTYQKIWVMSRWLLSCFMRSLICLYTKHPVWHTAGCMSIWILQILILIGYFKYILIVQIVVILNVLWSCTEGTLRTNVAYYKIVMEKSFLCQCCIYRCISLNSGFIYFNS